MSLVIFLILLSGCAEEESNTSFCDNITKETTRNECYYILAANSLDDSFCRMISTSDYYSSPKASTCYTNIAILKNDPKICKKTGDPINEAYCLSQVAENMQDIDTCRLIEDESKRESCIFKVGVLRQDIAFFFELGKNDNNLASHLASTTGNIFYCEFISSPSQYQNCIKYNMGRGSDVSYSAQAVSENNTSLCYDSNYKYRCFFEIGFKSQDRDICIGIENDYYRYLCNLGLKIRNFPICEDAINLGGLKGCFNDLNPPDLLQKELCIESKDSWNYCIQTQAERDDNPDYCLLLPPDLQDRCLSDLAKANDNISICEDIFDFQDRSSCYLALPNSLTKAFCDERPWPKLRDWCYSRLAEKEGSSDACESISDREEKEECYYKVAVSTGEILLCDQISSGSQECKLAAAIRSEEPAKCAEFADDAWVEIDFNSYGFQQEMQIPKDQCLKKIAEATLDESLCEGINDAQNRYFCLKNIFDRKEDIQNSLDSNISRDAQEKQDSMICLEVADTKKRISCIRGIALELLDYEQCRLMEDSEQVDICIRNIAISAKDQGICEEISGSRERSICYRDMAFLLDNPSICENNPDVSTPDKQICDAFFVSTEDEGSCSKFSDHRLRELCYLRLARSRSDTAVCDAFSDKAKKNDCLLFIALKDAEELKYCSKFDDEDAKKQCYSLLTSRERDRLKEVSFCMVNETSYYNPCVEDIAFETKDYSSCLLIDDKEYADDCIEYVVSYDSDISACSEIMNYSMCNFDYEECIINSLSNKARYSLNASYCDLIPGGENYCYYYVGFLTGNQSYCDMIGESKTRDECLMNICLIENDLSVCSWIDDPEIYHRSVEFFQLRNGDSNLCEMAASEYEKKKCYEFFENE